MQMMDMLPKREQELAYKTVRRFVLAWDPDFIKLTDLEGRRVDRAEAQLAGGAYVEQDGVDWN